MDENEYMNERVDKQIDWYSHKSHLSKQYYIYLKATEIILAALIPFLSGMIDEIHWIRYVIGATGILLAILGGLQIINKYREKWISYRTTSETLKHEKYMYSTKSGPYKLTSEYTFSDFVVRIESLISKENSDWNNMIANTDLKKEPEKKA